jgi:hypothetical protein
VNQEDQPQRYVVYDLRDPSRWVTGKTMTWQLARELGAQKLTRQFRVKVLTEQAWAVAVYDGETDEDAVRRGIEMKGGG